MVGQQEAKEAGVAVLVDCDNVDPDIVDHALRFVAQFGRVVVRRGYGNAGTLGGGRWQAKLIEQSFTPCLQYQYAKGKNSADIALALDAMEILFDDIADTFCLVTSDSDFSHLCRKLRERGAVVCIVGEAKTPLALRNASDSFSQWEPDEDEAIADASAKEAIEPATAGKGGEGARQQGKQRPMLVVRAVALLASDSAEGKVTLSALGSYLRRTDPSFTPNSYGHSGLLDMLRTYDLLQVQQEPGGHWSVKLDQENISRMPVNPLTGRASQA
jgi:uncharacterized protein (TIGR00288 family)